MTVPPHPFFFASIRQIFVPPRSRLKIYKERLLCSFPVVILKCYKAGWDVSVSSVLLQSRNTVGPVRFLSLEPSLSIPSSPMSVPPHPILFSLLLFMIRLPSLFLALAHPSPQNVYAVYGPSAPAVVSNPSPSLIYKPFQLRTGLFLILKPSLSIPHSPDDGSPSPFFSLPRLDKSSSCLHHKLCIERMTCSLSLA